MDHTLSRFVLLKEIERKRIANNVMLRIYKKKTTTKNNKQTKQTTQLYRPTSHN
jgi:hypothetical protein